MSYRVLQFTATIPAGTDMDTPAATALEIDGWQIEWAQLEVPAGPAGNMGFYLANNDVPWIPFTPGEHIVWDDEIQTYPADGWPNTSGWQIVGYNLDVYDHDVIVRFGVNPIPGVEPADAVYTFGFVESGVVSIQTVLP